MRDNIVNLTVQHSGAAYDVVIIGTGVSGSAAGALLAQAGKRVLLLEKSPRCGGSCHMYAKEGFRIDLGTHLFGHGTKGPIGKLLSRLGKSGRIGFARVRPVKIRTPFLHLYVPKSPELTPLTAWLLMHQLRIPLHDMPVVVKMLREMVALDDGQLSRLNDLTMKEYLQQFTTLRSVEQACNFLLNLAFPLSTSQVRAGEGVWALRQFMTDDTLTYPEGGSEAIPRILLQTAQENGAEIRTRCRVSEIRVESGRVTGVNLTQGGFVRAETVISTVGEHSGLYRHLYGAPGTSSTLGAMPDEEHPRMAIHAKIALRKPLVKAGLLLGSAPVASLPFAGSSTRTRSFHAARSHAGRFRRVVPQVQRVPPMSPIYCPVPSYLDPSLAPPGCELLTASTPVRADSLMFEGEDHWVQVLLHGLRTMIPGLERHMLFCDTFGVRFMESRMGAGGGSTASFALPPSCMRAGDMHVSGPVRGLYLAGDAAGANGMGVEAAAASSLLCTDTLLKNLREQRPSDVLTA